METRCLDIDNLREEAPEQWDDLMRYSECSRSLFYKFQFSSYFLFPSWLDRKRVDALKYTMSKFAPFTLMSSTTPDDDTRRAYMDAIVAFIDYLDQQLQRRY